MTFKRTLLIGSLLSVGLLGGCDDNTTILESFPAAGSALPYNVLRSDLIDHNTQQTFEVRNGGFGSAMTAHPTEPNQFYAMTDRGPNANFSTDTYGSGKKFPTPDYTPRIGLFELGQNGKITLLKEILLKRPDGTNITGLPNSAALGGTGETPYNADGSPILVNPTMPYDAESNPLKLDDYGLDGEGLVALSDGTFWVSDEYGPHLVHFDADGIEIGRINAFASDDRNTQFLPAEFANRWANRGMEGLAITPDETTLVGIMQSTLYNPTKEDVVDFTLTRIVTINTETGETAQYVYQQDKAKNSNSEIVALSATQFLIIERDGAFLFGGPNGIEAATPTAQKKVFRIDLTTGTNLETLADSDVFTQDADIGLLINGKTIEQSSAAELTEVGIKIVEKQEILDMVATVDYPHDKMEGLWIIDNNTLGVINDDDFATWSTGGELEQKMLDSNTIDHNHLYIIKDLNLSDQ